MLLRLRLSPHAFKRFTDNTDATDFIFSRILFLLVLPLDIGFTTDCFCAYTALDSLQQEIIRENPSARQAQTNPTIHNKYPWKNRSVASALSVIDFERGERAKGEWAHQGGTVFQTALPNFLNTRDFVPGYSRCARYWLPAKSYWQSRIWGWIKYQ